MLNGLGWVATALFAASYFCKTSRGMRRVQASAALLWVGYGIWMTAAPIIVANVIVAALAVYSDLKRSKPDTCLKESSGTFDRLPLS